MEDTDRDRGTEMASAAAADPRDAWGTVVDQEGDEEVERLEAEIERLEALPPSPEVNGQLIRAYWLVAGADPTDDTTEGMLCELSRLAVENQELRERLAAK